MAVIAHGCFRPRFGVRTLLFLESRISISSSLSFPISTFIFKWCRTLFSLLTSIFFLIHPPLYIFFYPPIYSPYSFNVFCLLRPSFFNLFLEFHFRAFYDMFCCFLLAANAFPVLSSVVSYVLHFQPPSDCISSFCHTHFL